MKKIPELRVGKARDEVLKRAVSMPPNRLEDEVLQRMLKTPRKPHKPAKSVRRTSEKK
jgi:hypothetical protein